MNRLQRFGASLSVFALALGGTLAATTAAGASPSTPPVTIMAERPTSCGQSLLCLYTGDGNTGSRQDQYARANGVCDGVLYNDQTSAIWNGSGKTVRFFEHAGCTGRSFVLSNGDGAPRMTWTHPTFVDEVTSYRWGG